MGKAEKYNPQVPITIDEKSSSFKVIETDHNHVHEGNSYSASLYSLSVADDGVLQMEMIVPADVEVHLKDVEFFAMDGPHLFELIENPNITDGTTEVCQCNRYRNSSDSSILELYSDPSGISGGTILSGMLFGGGSGVGGTSSGGSYSHKLEWVVEQGIYLMRITNKSGGAAAISMNVNWYQVNE